MPQQPTDNSRRSTPVLVGVRPTAPVTLADVTTGDRQAEADARTVKERSDSAGDGASHNGIETLEAAGGIEPPYGALQAPA